MAKLKKLLLVAGIGAAAAAVAKRMQAGGQSQAGVWQSPDDGPGAPVTPVAAPPYEPAPPLDAESELITDPSMTPTDPVVDTRPDPLSDPLPEEPTERP